MGYVITKTCRKKLVNPFEISLETKNSPEISSVYGRMSREGSGGINCDWIILDQWVISTTYPYHPWDWYIYLHEWLIFMVNVGKYTSPMDAMGYKCGIFGVLLPLILTSRDILVSYQQRLTVTSPVRPTQ